MYVSSSIPDPVAHRAIAGNIDDQRIVELAHLLDFIDHPADLVIGIGPVCGKPCPFLGPERTR